MTYSTCSWCHTLNAVRDRWCTKCRHAAHLARRDCDCRKCSGIFFGSEFFQPALPGTDPDRDVGGANVLPYGSIAGDVAGDGRSANFSPSPGGSYD